MRKKCKKKKKKKKTSNIADTFVLGELYYRDCVILKVFILEKEVKVEIMYFCSLCNKSKYMSSATRTFLR